MRTFILQCKLGNILKNKNISVYKLSDDIQERRATIYQLANNQDMDTKRIPASLIAKVCGHLEISPNDLFEVQEVE